MSSEQKVNTLYSTRMYAAIVLAYSRGAQFLPALCTVAMANGRVSRHYIYPTIR